MDTGLEIGWRLPAVRMGEVLALRTGPPGHFGRIVLDVIFGVQ
jgi:hypothetical protein